MDTTLETNQTDTLSQYSLEKGEYISTIGRRKTASARVRLFEGKKEHSVTVNDKPLNEYFKTKELQSIVLAPFGVSEDITDFYTVTVVVKGGGSHSQAEAVRHGIARALVEHKSSLRGELKKAGHLKRDPRKKERKKFGLKSARKSPQWSKR
jgi:small subunit ribosomal protein S9